MTRRWPCSPLPDPAYLINSARVAAKLGDKKKALDQLELALGKTQDAALKAEIIQTDQGAGRDS